MPIRSILCVLMLLLTSAFVNDARAKDNEPIKVFLLLGQSNMQGKGSANHLKELVQAEPEKYGHLMKDGQWIKRQDVWASFHDGAATPLTVGTTTRPGGRVGPEIGFGKGVAFGEAMLELLETYEGKKAEEQEAEKKPAEPIDHQPRTWTGTNGKTITGTFVRASGGKVVLLLENGRKREYASRNFTEEDRAYIRKYAD